jgi:hypothetical protein
MQLLAERRDVWHPCDHGGRRIAHQRDQLARRYTDRQPWLAHPLYVGSVEGLATASPDGGNIAYLSNQDGVWSFYVMHPDGSNSRKIMDLPGNFGRGEYDWFYERISWGP